jgi:NAD(P)-dependent dehydrogenase (short-subunit alcohol dehydrogenase family)
MMTDLNGKHALVTGGGTGIGAATALALSHAGAKVTIAGRRLEPLEETASRSDNIAYVQGDISDENSVAEIFDVAHDTQGAVDILIANAGGTSTAPLGRTSLELWHETLAVNLTGSFLCARAAMNGFARDAWGRIVFIGSTAGLKGYPYVSAYCAAKHGVIGLTRALALEVAQRNITVNAICPGFAETPLLDRSIETIVRTTDRSIEEARAALAGNNPQGRFIQPEEVASTVLWLCGENSQSVNGQAIAVAGGEI